MCIHRRIHKPTHARIDIYRVQSGLFFRQKVVDLLISRKNIPVMSPMNLICEQLSAKELRALKNNIPARARIVPAGTRVKLSYFGTPRCFSGTHYTPIAMTHRGKHELPQNVRFHPEYVKFLKETGSEPGRVTGRQEKSCLRLPFTGETTKFKGEHAEKFPTISRVCEFEFVTCLQGCEP